MPHYVILDENGFVTLAGFNRIAPEGSVIVDARTIAELVRMHADGENGLVLRPSSPAPVTIEGGFSVPDCPTGTRIQVVDTIGDEVLLDHLTTTELENVEFSLPDAGEYCVMVTSPPPYLMTEARLTI